MDVSQYLEIFIDESGEHLQTLSDCIMELEKEPEWNAGSLCENRVRFHFEICFETD